VSAGTQLPRFCTRCGGQTCLSVPAGDNRQRHVCGSCAAVHYENPKVVVGCLAEWQGRVLLCRRAIEPRRGYWTLPAGYLEMGETTEEGARRESAEEAGIEITLHGLYTVFSLPHINQLHLMYRASLEAPRWACGEETLEIMLVDEPGTPWDALAFRTVRETLTRYYADRRHGAFGVHSGVIDLRGHAR
jgi:ADP-ribose pyrophosphatase YjhB (NUDIX family)